MKLLRSGLFTCLLLKMGPTLFYILIIMRKELKSASYKSVRLCPECHNVDSESQSIRQPL